VVYATPYNYGYQRPPVVYDNTPGFTIRIQQRKNKKRKRRAAMPAVFAWVDPIDERPRDGGARPKGSTPARLPQSTVLHHECYEAAPEAAGRPAYDAEMSKFSARKEMQATTWTQRVLNRMGPLNSMNGREKNAGRARPAGLRKSLGQHRAAASP